MWFRTSRHLVLTAVALVPAGAHLFELPNKIALTKDAYFTLENPKARRSRPVAAIEAPGPLISTRRAREGRPDRCCNAHPCCGRPRKPECLTWSRSMSFTIDDLRAARVAGCLDEPSLERLLAFLSTRETATQAAAAPRFDLSHLLWYAGALIVLGAMGLFSTLAFSQMGGKGLITTAIAYAAVFTIAGDRLWRRGQTTVGGLSVAIAVSMVPLAVYGVQDQFHLWTHGEPGAYSGFYVWIKGSWLPMEIAAVVAAALALASTPSPSSSQSSRWRSGSCRWTLWRGSRATTTAASNCVAPCPSGSALRFWCSLGRPTCSSARRGDFAFWLHLFGLLTFWGGITASSSDSEIAKAIYCLFNVGLILLSVFLERRVYAVFGAFGIALYLGHLAEKVFKDSLLFPVRAVADRRRRYRRRPRVSQAPRRDYALDRDPHPGFLKAVEACPCEVSPPAARSAGARPGTLGGADEALLHRAGGSASTRFRGAD